ncbi:MAG: leader peptide processing enzyme [Treponema sp.]|nr:leader peptide processing enzyme [Treponema sp.]
MNKKLNTLLFVLGATLLNITVTILSFLGLLILYTSVLAGVLPEALNAFVLPTFFIAAIVISFLVYRFVLNKIMKKIKFEDYFDPIFRPRGYQPKRKD